MVMKTEHSEIINMLNPFNIAPVTFKRLWWLREVKQP
jgi:hypothetical protein